MSRSDYMENAELNWYRGTAYPAATGSVFISLHTADPTDAGTGAEVSGGSYARVTLSKATGSWAAPANNGGVQETSNATAITFPTPTANWGTVTHFGIWDASSGGNLLRSGALGTSRNILNGDQAPSFAAGALVMTAG